LASRLKDLFLVRQALTGFVTDRGRGSHFALGPANSSGLLRLRGKLSAPLVQRLQLTNLTKALMLSL
jgi:hypothetical protein